MNNRYLCERCGGTGQQPEGCYSLETKKYDEPAGTCTTCNGEGYLGQYVPRDIKEGNFKGGQNPPLTPDMKRPKPPQGSNRIIR